MPGHQASRHTSSPAPPLQQQSNTKHQHTRNIKKRSPMSDFVSISILNNTDYTFSLGENNNGYYFSNPIGMQAAQTPSALLQPQGTQNLVIGESTGIGDAAATVFGRGSMTTLCVYACDALKVRFGIKVDFNKNAGMPLIPGLQSDDFDWTFFIDQNPGNQPTWRTPGNKTSTCSATIQGADGKNHTLTITPTIDGSSFSASVAVG